MMKKLAHKLGKKKILFLSLNLVLLLAALACMLALTALSTLLPSQQQAARWQGDSKQEYAQISAFIPVDEKFSLESVAAFRTSLTAKLHEAALDVDTEEILFADAWSCVNKVSVSSALGKGDVYATAVGGEFFSFHPITLLSGSYIYASDIMQDRALLDEETAWLLFGGTEIQGLTFKINGVPFVVAGVIEREQDFATEKAYTDGMGIFISYDAYRTLNENASIQCYEFVMPDPVKNFALNFAKEKFPIAGSEIIRNTGRYSLSQLWTLLGHFDERSMHRRGVIYPYWENAARCVEDRCALLLLGALAALLLPVGTALVLLVRYAVLGKRKLEEELFPRWKDSAEEVVRARGRRRWEKKHRGSHEATKE